MIVSSAPHGAARSKRMKRASTGSEAKRQSVTISATSNQRLAAAGTRALEAYAHVRRSAERLGEELENLTSPSGIPTTDLDPEDSMVIAVEKVIATAPASRKVTAKSG